MRSGKRWLFAVALGWVGLGVGADALACGDVFIPAVDHRMMGVASAEKALEDRKFAQAAGAVVRMFPDIDRLAVGKDALIDRAMRTLALAQVRTEGRLDLRSQLPEWMGTRWSGKAAMDPAASVGWAVGALRRIDADRGEDASVKTDLGEALSHQAGGHAEALAILGKLADADLVTSPEGYAALGRLRAEAGDAAGRDRAVDRCRAMSREAAVCDVPAAGAPAGT